LLNSKSFLHSLQNLNPDYQQLTFLLAISGGVDSMVLFDLFRVAKLKFQVVHLNYGLRGADSDKDQKLVEEICKKNKIQFHLYTVSKKDNKPENSIQTWARDLRYDFFRKIQKEQKLDFIVTAHHLNDQLETFIIHLSKASGIKGLIGIPANENNILRPLLAFSKLDLYDFAKENGIEFREDISNQKNDYLRNKIRNKIVPELLEVNENFLSNFGKSISYLNQTKNFVEEKVLEIEKEIIRNEGEFVTIKKNLLFCQSDFVQFEILNKFGFKDVEGISKIAPAQTGKKFISNEYQLTVDRDILILKKLENNIPKRYETELILAINIENKIIIPESLQTEIKELGSLNWSFQKDKIQFPLKLRRKKHGDLFFPIGMIGKKKISKFCKDEKIPILAQQKIWLLCDDHDDILGVIPFRQDRRFAASKESPEVIKVKL